MRLETAKGEANDSTGQKKKQKKFVIIVALPKKKTIFTGVTWQRGCSVSKQRVRGENSSK